MERDLYTVLGNLVKTALANDRSKVLSRFFKVLGAKENRERTSKLLTRRHHELLHFRLQTAFEHELVEAEAIWLRGGEEALCVRVLVKIDKRFAVHLAGLHALSEDALLK